MDPKRATTALLFDDLFTYVLDYQGIDWRAPERNLPNFLHKFRPEIGLAALYFAREHKDEFEQKLKECKPPVFADRQIFFKYVYAYAEHVFKGKVLLLEFITFCAFATNLVTIACRNDKEEYVSFMTEAMMVVFEEKMDPYFHIAGGWKSLYEMAQQYVIFITPSGLQKDNLEDDKTSPESESL